MAGLATQTEWHKQRQCLKDTSGKSSLFGRRCRRNRIEEHLPLTSENDDGALILLIPCCVLSLKIVKKGK